MTTPRVFGTHAAIFWVVSLFAGGLNYLFNVVMAREQFLGPEAFGILAALSSLMYLDSILATTLTTATANYTAAYVARAQEGLVGTLIRTLSWRMVSVGLFLAALLVAGSALVVRFLHLPSVVPVLFLAPILLVTLLLGITTGALQGALQFGALAAITLLGAGVRLLLAVLLVLAGLGVSGVLLASLAAMLLSYGMSFLPLRQYLRGARQHADDGPPVSLRGLSAYVSAVFVAVLGLTALFSVDLFLARHFLSAEEAGLYSGLAMLGKVIYFSSLPIIMIMFPHVTKRAAEGRSFRGSLLVSGGLIASIALGVSALSLVVPWEVIRWTLGTKYLSAAPSLWIFALFLSCLTGAAWLLHVLLALRRTRVVALPVLCALLQALLIGRFHGSVREIALVSLASAAALFGALVLWVFFPKPLLRTARGEESVAAS